MLNLQFQLYRSAAMRLGPATTAHCTGRVAHSHLLHERPSRTAGRARASSDTRLDAPAQAVDKLLEGFWEVGIRLCRLMLLCLWECSATFAISHHAVCLHRRPEGCSTPSSDWHWSALRRACLQVCQCRLQQFLRSLTSPCHTPAQPLHRAWVLQDCCCRNSQLSQQ